MSFVEGRVARSLMDSEVVSESALVSAGQLLRRFHEASAGFLEADSSPQCPMLPPREPRELVCHGDLAPYNVTVIPGQAVGLIDFDTAHPAPRLWDVAYAVYRWAPLSDPRNPNVCFTAPEQAARAKLFLRRLCIDGEEAHALPRLISERLAALCEWLEARANAGDKVSQANIESGHVQLYRGDIEYVHWHYGLFAASMDGRPAA